MKKFVLLAAITGGALLVAQPVTAQEANTGKPLAQQKTFRVAIDAGHGGVDKGDVVAGVAAKDVNLAVAFKLKAALEARGIQVVMTRTDNRYVTLRDRTSLVETQGADCLVALRTNDNSQYRQPPIYEVNYKRADSALLANFLNNRLGEVVQTDGNKPLRRLDFANFFVLREVSVPAATVSGDLNLLRNSRAQDKFVQAIAAGITGFAGA